MTATSQDPKAEDPAVKTPEIQGPKIQAPKTQAPKTHAPKTHAPKTRVTLHFELSLASGEVIDSTFDRHPGSFELGDGTLPTGIESLIRGMNPGERQRFEVSPEQAFGMPNPNNIQRFKRSDFAGINAAGEDHNGDSGGNGHSNFNGEAQGRVASNELQVGMMISFADAANTELAGVVSRIEEDHVEVDFNHPLAGRSLIFDAEIVALENLDVTEPERINAN